MVVPLARSALTATVSVTLGLARCRRGSSGVDIAQRFDGRSVTYGFGELDMLVHGALP
jgi:hypothetical protein